jgi:RHS repeat-associated protein
VTYPWSGTGVNYEYAYDRYGNRWNQTLNQLCNQGVSVCIKFDQYNHVTGGPLSYDAAGNVINDGNHTYTYDAANHLTGVGGGGTTASYAYDGSGQRVAKTVNGTTVQDLYDLSGHVVTEENAAGQWNRGEVYAGGQHLATYRSDKTYFSAVDALGTERMSATVDQTSNESCMNLPFGDDLTCTGTAVGEVSPLHFTGKERDTESGNDYFNARYMASSMGRFLSPDPSNLSVDFWLPQTWNRYTYGLNNPLTMVDKNGLWPSPIHFQMNDSSFPGMSKQDIGILDKATWNMDWAPGQQDPRNAPQHGMQDGSGNVGGSPETMQEDARQQADDFISKQVATAQQAQADWEAQGHTGIAPAALTAFGNALHTVQDRTSPAHQGEQPWSGNAKDVPGHLWREKWPSNDQWTAGKNASRALFHRTFGDEFDWVFFKNPCARTSATDSQGNSTGWSGCQ